MKKFLIFIIVIIISSCQVYAGIYGKFEIGKDINTENIYFTEINLGYRFIFWNITSQTYGGYHTWQELNHPFYDTYSFNQEFKFKNFFIKYSHKCTHQVISSTHQEREELWWHYRTRPQALSLFSVGYEFEIH